MGCRTLLSSCLEVPCALQRQATSEDSNEKDYLLHLFTQKIYDFMVILGSYHPFLTQAPKHTICCSSVYLYPHSLLYRQGRWRSKYELPSHTSAPWAPCSAPNALQSSVAVWSPAVLQTTSSPMKHAVDRGSCFTGTQKTLCSQGKFLPDFTSREQEEPELDCPQSCLQTVLRNNGWWFI